LFKSLISQKINIFLYWSNFWDKKFNFKFFFFSIYILKKLIYKFFFKFLYILKYKKNFKKHINKFFFGFFWIYNYQNWIILNLNYFSLLNFFKKKLIILKKYNQFFFKLNKIKLIKKN